MADFLFPSGASSLGPGSETALGDGVEDVVTFTVVSGGSNIPRIELCCPLQQLCAACGWQLCLQSYLGWSLWELSVLLCGFEQLGIHGVCVHVCVCVHVRV